MKERRSTVVDLSVYREAEVVPPDLIKYLEDVLKAAKDGKLVHAILDFNYDTGDEFYPGGMMMWRKDGRLDCLHSACHVLADSALQNLIGDE